MKLTNILLLIISFISATNLVAQPASKIYTTDYGSFSFDVIKANLDGTDTVTLKMPLRPQSIAVDWKSNPQKLYVGLNPTSGNGKIIRCNTDGTEQEDIITDVTSASDIELDLVNRKIYWAQDTYNDDKIYKANMDGLNSEIQQIFSSTTAMVNLWGISLDVETQTIWFTLRGSTCYSSSIKRISTNGSGLTYIISPVCNPHDIEYFNGKLYWSNADGLMKCETDGSNIDTILLGAHVHSLSIDASNYRIYWTDYLTARIKRVDFDGTNEIEIPSIIGTLTGIDTDYNPAATDVEEKYQQPLTFSLSQNYPNPFNPSTRISWQSLVSTWQTLKLYDVLGNEIATLVDEFKSAGKYVVEFKTLSINQEPSSGVYFYQLKAGDFIQTKKMILLR
jgi:hypothetical protein